MRTHQLLVGGAAAISLLAFDPCLADEGGKQSAASRQAAKAREYGNRADKEGPPDVAAAASADAAGQKAGDKTPLLDSPALDKAAKETADNWKKMDKMLNSY